MAPPPSPCQKHHGITSPVGSEEDGKTIALPLLMLKQTELLHSAIIVGAAAYIAWSKAGKTALFSKRRCSIWQAKRVEAGWV